MKCENIIYGCRYASPCGDLLLGEYGGRICMCDWMSEPHHSKIEGRLKRVLGARFVESPSGTPLLAAARKQLDEYFSGKRSVFDLPLMIVGSDFQQCVWRELQRIPFGATVSYATLAQHIGRPSACRAVANANGANALSIFIPCHRVISHDGNVGGYGGGIAAKRLLLDLESESSLF